MAFEAAKAISKALAPLIGGAGKELSGYLADQIRFLRWKSAVHILERAKKLCEKKRLDPKAVPIKFIIPFLESASLEDIEHDDTLAEMWASLFARAVTSYEARHATYIDLLKKLSSKDAEFVISLYKKMKNEEPYWDGDSPFDADLSNVNDKQDVIHSFEDNFAKRGAGLLKEWHSSGHLAPAAQSVLMRCIDAPPWRVDLLPLRYDLSVYGEKGFQSSVTGTFSKRSNEIESVASLATFNLMEKFELVAWHPRRPSRGELAIRATCSFAILTSLGFDFIDSCATVNVTKAKSKGRRKASGREIRKF